MKRKILSCAMALLLSVMALAAIFLRERDLTYAYLPQDAPAWEIALFFLLFFSAFTFWMLKAVKKKDLTAMITVGFFSFFFGISSTISEDPGIFNGFSNTAVLLRMTGIFPLIYVTVHGIYLLLDERAGRRAERIQTLKKNRSLQVLLCGGILLALWIPFISRYFPGNMAYDTGTAILQYYQVLEHQNNPWFLVWLYGLVIRIGDRFGNANTALFVFCLIQALLFIAGISEMLVHLWRKGASVWWIGALLLIYGTIPSFSAYAFCMGKDSSFALCLLWMGIGLLHFSEKDIKVSIPGKIGFALSCFLTPLMKNGAWIPVLVILLLLFIRKQSSRVFLTGVVVLVLLSGAVFPRLVGNTASITESLSIPMQQAARVVKLHEDEISKAEKKQYKDLMPMKYWRKYKSGISDPVKKWFEPNPDGPYLQKFLKLWLTEAQKHPRTYAGAAVLMNYAYYVPLADRSDIKSKLLLGNQKARIAEVSEISSLMENQNSGLAEVQRFMDSLNQTPVLRLLTRIGLYAWVLIAAFVHCVGRRKSYESWMLLLLPMTVLIGCCFSPVNGYYRYAFPMIVTTPLLASAAVMLPDRKATGAARK